MSYLANLVLSSTPLTSSPRRAYMGKLLHDAVHIEKRRLKTYGSADKLDYCTCTWCMCAPDTYHHADSLAKPAIFKDIVYNLGVSCMHMKVRFVRILYYFGLNLLLIIH